MCDAMESLDQRDAMEYLEQRAVALRSKLSPLSTGSAHAELWSRRGEDGGAYLGQRLPPGFRPKKSFPPANMDEWLGERSLKKGSILGDGRCQYRAVSRALFGDEHRHFEELKSLAVELLHLRKEEFLENAVSEINSRKASLVAKGFEPTYEGWCDALDLFEEWGNDFTLTCMCWLMLVEIRVVVSMPRFSATSAPRVMCLSHDPTDKAGPPLAVIYLVLEQDVGAEHYSTVEAVEADLSSHPPRGQSGLSRAMDAVSHASLESDSKHTNYSAVGDELVDGEEHSMIELMSGVGYGDGEFKKVAFQDRERRCFDIYRMHLRSGASELLRSVPYTVKSGPPKPAQLSLETQLTSSTMADVQSWQQKLAEGPTATRDLAQASSICQHDLCMLSRDLA